MLKKIYRKRNNRKKGRGDIVFFRESNYLVAGEFFILCLCNRNFMGMKFNSMPIKSEMHEHLFLTIGIWL